MLLLLPLLLLPVCVGADKGSFEDVSRHKYFNTNNLWVNLPMLKVCARTR
jgi:UDP-N-acetylglucosamine pyrophosphorylase